jgi:uncharacterized phage protein (TIGR01671 family)
MIENRYLSRGKRKDTKEWVYGYYVKAGETYYIFTGEMRLLRASPAHHLVYKDFVRHEVIPETVGQYPGLKGRLRDRIFEGDIVEYQKSIYIVRHTKILCAFEMYKIDDDFKMKGMYLIHSLIIGNIHDTPELLKKETHNA